MARPTLGPGEIRVAVEAAGVNFVDVMVGMGEVDDVRTLGAEFAGRIVETGAEVSGLERGHRVAGFAAGAFGPEVATSADLVVKAPPGLSSPGWRRCRWRSRPPRWPSSSPVSSPGPAS